jgi:ion channel-forming bestrophin family protein
VLACAAVGALAVWVHREHAIAVTPIAHTMIGVALGLLLVFRTNASYDRYWEGRRLLGGMVIRIRDVVRQVVAYLPGDEHAAKREEVRRLACAYFRLAAQLLRSERDLAPLGPLLTERERTELEPVRARPQVVSTWMTRLLAGAGLPEQRLFAMDQNLTGLTDALAGCERILRTPVPFAYAQHIKIFCVLFCFTAPFTMAEAMGWATPVAAGLLAFALFGVDEIGVEIEDPFGYDPNDLPVDAMGDGIEAATKEMLLAAR